MFHHHVASKIAVLHSGFPVLQRCYFANLISATFYSDAQMERKRSVLFPPIRVDLSAAKNVYVHKM